MEICKKIDEIFKIYKEPIYIFGTLLILIGFFNYIGFTNENFSLFIYSWLIIFISYFLLFRLTDVEIFLTRKITYIVILSISFILYSQKDLGLVNYDTLYILGAIIAFWYGYKKYEIDKELEIINNLNFKVDIHDILIDWNIKRILYQKKLLKDYIWKIVINKYQLIFFEKIGLIGELENYENIQDLARNNSLLIKNLLNYNETETYFKTVFESIDSLINYNIKFYHKIDKEKYHSKICYLKALKNGIK